MIVQGYFTTLSYNLCQDSDDGGGYGSKADDILMSISQFSRVYTKYRQFITITPRSMTPGANVHSGTSATDCEVALQSTFPECESRLNCVHRHWA